MSEDIFDYLFDVGARNSYQRKETISAWVIWEMRSKASSIRWRFDDYPNNDGLGDINGDEGM